MKQLSGRVRYNNRTRRRFCGPESLETRRVLAVTFVPQPAIISSDLAGPTHAVPADLDGDGDLDLVATSYLDGRVGWYANLDGQGSYSELTLISSEISLASMVRAADLDGDNDLDVVVASVGQDRVSWFANEDGQGSFGAERIITEIAIAPQAIDVADIDGDGDADVISTSSDVYDSDVSWYQNDGSGNFGNQQIISVALERPFSTVAADVDHDGDMDVLTASYDDDKVAWYENTDGLGSFGRQQVVADDLLGASEVIAADLDGDGDIDIAAGSSELIVWFQNTDGKGIFSSSQLVSGAAIGVETLEAADIDDDGDLDLIAATAGDNQVTWYENLDSIGGFGVQKVVATATPQATSALTGDLDGDGDLDVAIASFYDDSVVWVENLNGEGDFAPAQTVSRFGAIGVEFVNVADIDGDGDLDALSASQVDGTFAWYENTDGLGTFGPQAVIDAGIPVAISITTGDLDGDDDLDVLVASAGDSTVGWYENLDRQGMFSTRNVISDAVSATEAAITADLDGDGDLDVIAAATNIYESELVWFENAGQGSFGGPQSIWSDFRSPRDLRAADIDEDGDLDLVVASAFDNRVSWFENTNGLGSFGNQQIISTAAQVPLAIDVGDIDGDSHLDVVTGSFRDNEVSWFANPGGNGDFSAQVIISSGEQAGFESVELSDLDGDGDLDVVAGSIVEDPSKPALKWYENLDGQGTFSSGQTIDDRLREVSGIVAADLNGSGRPDLLVSSFNLSRIVWYRNDAERRGDFTADGELTADDIDALCQQIRSAQDSLDFDLTGDALVNDRDLDELIINILGTTYGDANLDGIFDSSDLVAVFRVGEYEDSLANNSTWSDGDWNCDGDFNTQDVVTAFQAGGYVGAARATSFAPASIPDAAASLDFLFQQESRRRNRTHWTDR